MMPRWLRRVFLATALRLKVWDHPVLRAPAPGPLPTTRPELDRTRSAHHERLARADRVLDDFARWDGALRLVRRKR